MRCLALLFCLAGAVWAQAVPVDGRNLDLVPGLTQQARNQARRALGTAGREFTQLQKQIQAVDAKLKQKPAPEEAKKLRAERARLEKLRPQVSAKLRKGLLDAGMTVAQLERFKKMPRGPLREQRYNHGVLLELEDLDDPARGLLTRLIDCVDGAQAALQHNLETQRRGLADVDKMVMQQVTSRMQQQIQQTERRFWRMVYYVLSPEQMRTVRKLVSPRSANIPQLREQMLYLPGLEPQQGGRIQSLFTEHESEVGADRALVRTLQMRRNDKKLAPKERQEINAQLGAAYKRMGELNNTFRERVRAVLTEDQLLALRAAPPHMNVGERGRPPWEITRAMQLHGEQPKEVRKLGGEANRFRQKKQREVREKTKGMEVGPESPQMMTMMVMQRGAQGEIFGLYRELGRRLLLDVLEPDQVAAWVIKP